VITLVPLHNKRMLLGMDTLALFERNRILRKQNGKIIETRTAFFGRYYHTLRTALENRKSSSWPTNQTRTAQRLMCSRSWTA
jgi:hypothetical protein